MKKLTIIITIALLSCQPAWSSHAGKGYETGLDIKYCGHGKEIVAITEFHVGKTQAAMASGWKPFETPIVLNYRQMVKCGKGK